MSRDSGRLAGRVACITGAGSGLGRAMALRFAEEGAIIAAQDLRWEAADKTVKLLDGDGHRAFGGDVCDEGDMVSMFAQIHGAWVASTSRSITPGSAACPAMASTR